MLDMWNAERPDLAAVDEIVTIAMRGSCVVIRPASELDGLRTRVFVDALNAAVLAGSVVVHVPADADAVAAVEAPFTVAGAGELAVGREPVDVAVVRAGVISVSVSDVLWTIDIGAGRFFRSDAAIDVRFLVDADWTRYTRMWFSATAVAAETTCGSYVMGNRAGVERPDDVPVGPRLAGAIA